MKYSWGRGCLVFDLFILAFFFFFERAQAGLDLCVLCKAWIHDDLPASNSHPPRTAGVSHSGISLGFYLSPKSLLSTSQPLDPTHADGTLGLAALVTISSVSAAHSTNCHLPLSHLPKQKPAWTKDPLAFRSHMLELEAYAPCLLCPVLRH